MIPACNSNPTDWHGTHWAGDAQLAMPIRRQLSYCDLLQSSHYLATIRSAPLERQYDQPIWSASSISSLVWSTATTIYSYCYLLRSATIQSGPISSRASDAANLACTSLEMPVYFEDRFLCTNFRDSHKVCKRLNPLLCLSVSAVRREPFLAFLSSGDSLVGPLVDPPVEPPVSSKLSNRFSSRCTARN